MSVDEGEAIRVLSLAARVPEDSIRASRVGSTKLWSVGQVDDEGSPMLGAWNLVGPDGRLWTFSSNPAIHDPGFVIEALVRLYGSDAARLVEPDRLADRVRELTEERDSSLRSIVAAALAGELRTPPPRWLP